MAQNQTNQSYKPSRLVTYQPHSLRVELPKHIIKYNGPLYGKLPQNLQFGCTEHESLTITAYVMLTRANSKHGSVVLSNRSFFNGFELICPLPKTNVLGMKCSGTRDYDLISDHHNVDEPYPMELFHISDMDFVLIYYVKFLTKFERIICEFLHLYQQYCSVSDDMESDVPLQLSLVGSNPRQTYMESMLKAYNTMLWGRQSREHPWIKVQTDKRKSQKFRQDLIYMVKYMKSNDIDALHELMKQCPDLNTKDRESGKTVLQIALDKSLKQPSF